jgi:hypothetical protein
LWIVVYQRLYSISGGKYFMDYGWRMIQKPDMSDFDFSSFRLCPPACEGPSRNNAPLSLTFAVYPTKKRDPFPFSSED